MVPILPIAMGLGAVGSFLNARSQNRAASQQNRRYEDLRGMIQPFLGQGPSSIEDLIMQQYQGNQSQSLLGGLNQSTDPILQSMRRGPNTDFLSQQLRGLSQTGDPFDMTQILSTLEPLRERRLNQSVGDLRASAPGLGQRFGSAMRGAEVDLRQQAAESAAALDAQTLFQGHESAANRRLQATGQLQGLEGLELQRGQSIVDLLLRRGQLGLAGQGQQNQLLQLLMQGEQGRRGQGLQALGILGGTPTAAAPGYGGAFTDVGQLLLLSQLMEQGGGGGTSGFQTGWRPPQFNPPANIFR